MNQRINTPTRGGDQGRLPPVRAKLFRTDAYRNKRIRPTEKAKIGGNG